MIYLIGLIIILLYPYYVWLTGLGDVYFSFNYISNTNILLITHGFGFFGVALFEEGLFRGFILEKLSIRYGRIISTGIFL